MDEELSDGDLEAEIENFLLENDLESLDEVRPSVRQSHDALL